MANYTADNARTPAGVVTTKRTGTASADTVTAGSSVVWVNAGAGTHVVTLTTNNTYGGLAIADQTISIPATSAKVSYIPNEWGDASGNVAVAIDATAAEVTFYVLAF
jgi:plastocyanin